MANNFIGYSLFSGIYGEFTVPVFENDTFEFDDEAISYLQISVNDFNKAEWNTAQNIYNLVLNPGNVAELVNPFRNNSSPQMAITAVHSTEPYAERLYSWVNKLHFEFKDVRKGTNTSISNGLVPVIAIFRFGKLSNKYYLLISENSQPRSYKSATLFTLGSPQHQQYIPVDSVTIQANPVIIGEGPITSISVNPSYNYYYEKFDSTKLENYDNKIFINLYSHRANGYSRKLSPDDVIISFDGTNAVSDVRLVENTYNNYGIHSLVILYDREIEIPESYWNIRFKLKSNKSITTTLEMRVIRLTEDVYDPGVGGGVDSGAVGPGPNGSFGGGGNFGIVNGTPETSDPIEPSLPATGSFEGSVASAGLFVHYAMNANMLEIVGDWLWATDLGLIIAKEVLSILYGSPIESAISLMSYPFNVTALPGVVSNQQELFWGAHGAGFNATAITNPYATIDWGTIQLTEFWGNFLDYAPHTKLELYLPWCTGFVPIDPNECLPGTLRVVTNIELAKGTCLHNVIGNDGRVIATHTGTCGKQLPLTALDTSGKALSMVTAAVSTAVAGAAGAAANRAGEIAGANYMAGARQLGMTPSQAVTGAHVVRQEAMAPHQRTQGRARNMALAGSAAATRTPSSVQRNGSFSGSTAGLGVQFPYLIISRPTQSVPAQYGHHYGYPSNIYTPLANLRGYTEVGEIHLTGIVANDSELSELDSLLKSGVIF